MKFFEKIKKKLRVRNLAWTIGFFLGVIAMVWLLIATGFSLKMPGVIFTCMYLVVAVIFLIAFALYLKSFIQDTEYKIFMEAVARIGDVEEIGEMISDIRKSGYAKSGELRYNKKIVFYMKGTDVFIASSKDIAAIKAESNKEHIVRISCGKEKIKIKTNKENVFRLAEEMQKIIG